MDATTSKPNPWNGFSSGPGNFSVLCPGDPKEITVFEQSTGGEIEFHSFIVESDDETAYGVVYNDYPPTANLPEPETAFDRSQGAIIEKHKAELLAQESLQVQSHPAREFEFKAGGKANYSGRVRIILIDRRLYQLVTVFLTDNPHPADRAKFFDSFSLKKN